MNRRIFIALTLALFVAAQAVHAEDPAPAGPRVLFISKSAGFQHSVIERNGVSPGMAETIFENVVKAMGGSATATKDASLVNAENLKNFDVVVFYTTGILTEPGTDGMPPLGPNGFQELQDWIKGGGGFIGLHCATDTFHGEGDTVTPYIEMIGGEFDGHGPQFFGLFTVVDPTHPAMTPFTSPYKVNDEWYAFKNLNTANIRVLALLDARVAFEKMRGKGLPAYSTPYPIAWCRGYGNGRVFYNAMGHREDVWESEVYQKSLANAIIWAKGEGPLNAEPNYDKVMAEFKAAAPATE
jgi:type 1 glutamine amidotransferase